MLESDTIRFDVREYGASGAGIDRESAKERRREADDRGWTGIL
jgi:hypothetical protein